VPPAPIETEFARVHQRAESLLSRLLEPAKLPAPSLKVAQRVAQKRGQPWSSDLPEIWDIRFSLVPEGGGHLFLRADGEMVLEEFALDFPFPIPPLNGGRILGVPNLQQFPIPSPSGTGRTASGCVPTAGAALMGFWSERGLAAWLHGGNTPAVPENAPGTPPAPAGPEKNLSVLKAATLRLRERMPMLEIPDKQGYTDRTMSLSGAFDEDLARALREEARAHGVPVEVQHGMFSREVLRTETAAGRPMLVTCRVRLPHKPELSWGHALVAVGWQQVEDFDYVGVVDNFFPVKNPATVRWIEKSTFGSAIRVQPIPAETGPYSPKTGRH
jgi:hypothetical protein